jgi:hypothetical protein
MRYSDRMKIKILQLTLLLAAISLAGACAGESGSPPENGSPTSRAEAIETTVETPISDTPATAPTVVLTTGVSVTGLTAFCSLDQGAAKITCHGSGTPEGSESQLKWGSNISGWVIGPSYEISITEWVSAVIVTLELCQGLDCEKVETYVDTSWVTPGDNGSGSSDNTSTSPPGGASTNATPVATLPADSDPDVTGLTAFCSLDQGAAKITCHGSGTPEGSESQLKWGSNISGWAMGPSYEISITEWVSAVIVTLELCQGLDCEKVETYVDTARVTPGDNGSGSSDNTSTSPPGGASTNATPVAIESLTCDDDQIVVRYNTTCRAKLSGQVDYVKWKMEKGDRAWNRDDATEDALKEVLVLKKITRDTVGDYVIPFKACTGGGDWYPGAKCVEQSVTIKVVAGAPLSVGNGLPCESDVNPSFERWIMDEGQTKEIWATGTATHSGTSQHSYTYPRYELEPNGIPVYAPTDGYLWAAGTNLTYSNGVKDYGLQFMVSCEVWIKFGHVVNPVQRIVDLVDSVADENGHGQWSAKPPLEYVNEQIDPIFFKAGEVMFRHLPNRPGTNQGFDYGLFNVKHINEYLNPPRWDKADTYYHALCPWKYQAEPVRSEVKGFLLPYQSDGVICHGVNREVVGTLAGMWHFADPTAPVPERHTLRYGGDLTFVEYFDGLIHVGGINSKDILFTGQAPKEEFILRLGPGEATFALPQEVTTSHCYEGSNLAFARHPNNFDYMFLYVETVDNMTINVAFDSGSCPASLPAEYIILIR